MTDKIPSSSLDNSLFTITSKTTSTTQIITPNTSENITTPIPSLPPILSLKTDWVFKWMFGQEKHKPLLIDLLNAILQGKEPPIIDLTFNNTEQIGKQLDNRNVIFDIYCTTSDNTHLIIEMQNIKQPHYIDRALAYGITSMNKQLNTQSNWHKPLEPVYVISFVNFIYFEKDSFISHTRLNDLDTGTAISSKLNLIFLELPKIKKNQLDYQHSRLDAWLYLINYLGEIETMPESLTLDKTFREIFQKANTAQMTAQEFEDFIRRNKYHWNHLIALDERYTSGMAEGKLEGLTQVAKSLKTEGMDITLIQKVTGLSAEKIKQL